MHRLVIVVALMVASCGDDGDSAAIGDAGTLRDDIVQVSTQVGGDCNELFYGTQCEGPFIKSGSLGKIVYGDCRALGHETCVAPAGGGYGRCGS